MAELGSSPYINHFIQPDTIIPNPSNPQDWNRYGYARNNPLKYTDPSGHKACDGAGMDGACDQSNIASTTLQMKVELKKSFGVKLKGKWKDKEVEAAYQGVYAVGEKLATFGGSAESAFRRVFKNGVNFTRGGEGAGYGCTSVTFGGCTSSDNQINFWSMSNDMVKNVVHELGHAFYHAIDNPLLGNGFSRKALIRNASYGGDEALVWEQHPISMNEGNVDIPTELFADTFIAWTYGEWNKDPLNVNAVTDAQNEMNRIAGLIP
jgi:hypothetical protein